MTKWYETPSADDGVIISSRIRLARNLDKYPFPARLEEKPELADAVTNELIASLMSGEDHIGKDFTHVELDDQNIVLSQRLLEKHCISPEFAKKHGRKNVLISKNESVSIMINEEDHLRLQSISPGGNIDDSLFVANKIDDAIEKNTDYAFDKDYGYLTACPTNTGTGMRASYMLHLPALEATDKLRSLFVAIGKLGMTARGIYGEGSGPQGGIYQVSNQTTIGKTEEEIVAALKSVASKLIDQEKLTRERLFNGTGGKFHDKIYRSYGILKYARKLTSKEAMNYLSDVRLGLLSGRLEVDPPKKTIYNMMMEIQPGGMQERAGRLLDQGERDALRAEFIRETL